jgi:HSP20 family protein
MRTLPVRRSIIDEIFERPFSLLREFERSFSEAVSNLEDKKSIVWSPNVDMIEEDDRYEVIVELPGVNKEDVKVHVKDNVLTITGEKKEHYERKERTQIHYQSIWYGKFHTEISLPTDVEIDKISAQFKNGVLKLIIPKSEKQKGREIQIELKE